MDIEKQIEFLRRGVAEIVSEAELRQKLLRAQTEGEPLRIKLGLDPTAPDIHLGIVVVLKKLRQFQDLGHLVYIVIGDFTAMIGDPSGKSETRRPLSPPEISENAKTYAEQYNKFLDPEKTKVVFNSQWLGKMDFAEVIRLASRQTIARVLERDDFSRRIKEGRPIGIHEILYPLCQGYDSVVLKADVELGGTDQKFNILTGRDLQREFQQEPQVAFLMPILAGLDGIQKMSKSLGNYVGVDEPPSQIYGKIMSISDDLMPQYFELLTDIPLSQIEPILVDHPREAKKKLAREIVTMCYSQKMALQAEEEFENIFQKKGVPENIPEIVIPHSKLKDGKIWIVNLLTHTRMVNSRSEARRLIEQGGVSINQHRIIGSDQDVFIGDQCILRIGKTKFVRVIVQ